jgi:hypothetical protein
MLDPLIGEALREVLYRVQPEALQFQLIYDPFTPALDVLLYLRVTVV